MGEIILWSAIAAAVIAAVLLTVRLRRKPQPPPEQEEQPYNGAYFTTQLTEMLDTISRATLERDCSEFTELLYEQARFCEPSDSPEFREAELEILQAVCDIHPDNSDTEINEKCAAISQMLERRQNLLHESRTTTT